MRSLLFTTSVFADAPGGGNPAGVHLDAKGLSDAEMAAIAAELDVATTAFVTRPPRPSRPECADFALRFFTPDHEVPMCGHATIAAVSALVTTGWLPFRDAELEATARTPDGDRSLHVSRLEDGAPLVTLELGTPSVPTDRPGELDHEELRRVLGGPAPAAALTAGRASAGLRHLFVPYPRLEDLGRLRPDFDALRELSRRLGVDTVGAFALEHEPDGALRLRDLCPAIGKDEEAASGTTSGALVAFLVRRDRLTGTTPVDVEVRQGVEMGCPSRIRVRHVPGIAATGVVPRLAVTGRTGPPTAVRARRSQEVAR
jgi:trans-2,3-dihydro-3-hydroxyanthranilate isomerase